MIVFNIRCVLNFPEQKKDIFIIENQYSLKAIFLIVRKKKTKITVLNFLILSKLLKIIKYGINTH